MLYLWIAYGLIMLILIFQAPFSLFFKRNGHTFIENSSSLQYEEKNILSYDNTPLKGYLNVNNPLSFVIIAHDLFQNHSYYYELGEIYSRELHYSVLLVDLRCHGMSKGKYITYGIKDREDLLSWVDYLQSSFGSKCNIIIHGFGMGATAGLLTATYKNVCIKGIISDSPFSNPYELLCRLMKKRYPLIGIPSLIFSVLFFKACSIDIKATDLKNTIHYIKCPILFIHGEKDSITSPSNSILLFNKLICQKDIFIQKDATHINSFYQNREGYIKRIKDFLLVIF